MFCRLSWPEGASSLRNLLENFRKKNGARRKTKEELFRKNLATIEKFHFSKLEGSDTSYTFLDSSFYSESKYVVIVYCRVRGVGEFV